MKNDNALKGIDYKEKFADLLKLFTDSIELEERIKHVERLKKLLEGTECTVVSGFTGVPIVFHKNNL